MSILLGSLHHCPDNLKIALQHKKNAEEARQKTYILLTDMTQKRELESQQHVLDLENIIYEAKVQEEKSKQEENLVIHALKEDIQQLKAHCKILHQQCTELRSRHAALLQDQIPSSGNHSV